MTIVRTAMYPWRQRALPRLIGVALGSCLAACSGGVGDSGGAANAPLRSVRVEPVRVVPLGQTLDAVGVLTPKDEVRLSFKVGGLIEALRVEEGQSVKAGQVLAELKQTEVAASLEAARQSAQKASRDLARGRALLADGVATEEQVQDLATSERVAAAALAGAQFNATHARILAPGAGVVLRKLAEVDELVTAGQPVLVVGGADRGWIVRVGLADRDAVRVRLGDAARIEFDAWPGRDFAASVTNLASAADPATGTFAVELAVQPGDAHFIQGLVAKVRLRPNDEHQGRVVPLTALIEANERESHVFVVDTRAAVVAVRRVSIQIGRMVGGDVEVLSGLEAGTLVVTDGGAFLDDGQRVRVAAP